MISDEEQTDVENMGFQIREEFAGSGICHR